MLKVLFSAKPAAWDEYETPLTRAFEAAGLQVDLARDHAPSDVDYIVFAPNGPVTDFTPYVKTKAVMSLWAGVETVVGNHTLTQPLARMVDHGLTRGMVEWVVGHTMRHHLGMDTHILGQDGVWRLDYPPLAEARPVTILGLGALGEACGQALNTLGFPVTGWSRNPKDVSGIKCLHGEAGLTEALTGAQVVILLLPSTPATENTLNADRLALLAKGAFIINPGRGPLIDDDALLAALDNDQIGHATLDVFRVEPLPTDHPYWAHPKVTVTPHIASTTRPDTAAQIIAQNIKRGEDGLPFLHLVDRNAGY
ncbi:MAG: glyoxylate/hydroxypyruvate reductase A [Loktanella sp.]|jgi:glyoxylate/hydroxypyruvate reductase|nr:glyoxylate/hydroxypyruvate reductase A [Loktanella sp.]MDO7623880.1 glyoxylate/hydroxypyruvate reductase A [Loktanella sp.]MDO7627303.1 glyoxylate/hydroxypyruvate reductase A [Loktanella sp.]MDO7665933.1 glyoxylate/hydroxypyruvate reductase A [Loktanella sp.]MDO7684781.1 glyoxylate/hydroxypyruvate reductase A [Loktanella sp.]